MMTQVAEPARHVSRGADLDPALLAFVKCHISSPLKWDVMRYLTEYEGEWLSAEQVVAAVHRAPAAVGAVLAELVAEGVAEEGEGAYRLPRHDPTTILLRRLLDACMRSRELRGVIAAQLLSAQRALAAVV